MVIVKEKNGVLQLAREKVTKLVELGDQADDIFEQIQDLFPKARGINHIKTNFQEDRKKRHQELRVLIEAQGVIRTRKR